MQYRTRFEFLQFLSAFESPPPQIQILLLSLMVLQRVLTASIRNLSAEQIDASPFPWPSNQRDAGAERFLACMPLLLL